MRDNEVLRLLAFLRGAAPEVAERRLHDALDLQYQQGHIDGFAEGRHAGFDDGRAAFCTGHDTEPPAPPPGPAGVSGGPPC